MPCHAPSLILISVCFTVVVRERGEGFVILDINATAEDAR